MGLFSFFIKSAQKTEVLGDTYVKANQFGSAKIEYESALSLIEKKHPDDAAMKARVQEKLTNSKEALARQHLQSGDQLVEVKACEEALKLFALALSLTENPELQQALRERMVLTVDEQPVEVPQATSMPTPEGELTEADAEHEFEILCMTLPEEISAAYRSYGATFKDGFLALSRGDFKRAAEKLRMALDETQAPDSHIPVELATALMNLGQTQPAIDQLADYLENNPASFHAMSLLCDLYCELKRFDLAHGVLDRAPETLRASPDVSRLRGRMYYHEGDYHRAEQIFRPVLDTGWDTDVARELAMTLATADKTKEAMMLYADLLNQCSRCRQRINPLDQKAFADLSFKMNDYSDKTLNLFLTLASEHEELRSDCFLKASLIFRHNGNETEAARFQKLAQTQT